MAQNFRVEIEGDKELIKKLNRMSKGFRSKALLHAVTQGGEIVEREAKAQASVRKGTLRDSITTVKLKSASKLAKVGVSWRKGKGRKDAFYGLFIEKGTKPRMRKKWRKKPLKTGPVSTGTGPVRSFLIPAFHSKREQVAREIKVQLSRLIRRAVKKGL